MFSRCSQASWEFDSELAIIEVVTIGGRLLRPWRRANGISQRGLAARSGIAQPSIAALESGRHDATAGTIEDLVAAIGGRLTILPTRTRPVVEAGEDVAALVRAGRDDAAYRELIQIADDLAREHGALRVALTVTPPPPTGDPRFDAFLAALVEHRLAEERLPRPAWTCDAHRVLTEPWFVVDLAAYRAKAKRTSPPSFRKHNVFVNAAELESV
jgi:transcriptional regulator with XRE-family HTH domain